MSINIINGTYINIVKSSEGTDPMLVNKFSGTDMKHFFNQLEDRTCMDTNMVLYSGLTGTTALIAAATNFSTTKHSGSYSLKNSNQASPDNTSRCYVDTAKHGLFTAGKISTWLNASVPPDTSRNQVIWFFARGTTSSMSDNIVRCRFMFNNTSHPNGNLLLQKIVSGSTTNILDTGTSLSLTAGNWYKVELVVTEDASNIYVTPNIYNSSGSSVYAGSTYTLNDAIFRNDTYRYVGWATSESNTSNADYTLHDLWEVLYD
jgi:hypothetical protein